MTGERKAGRKQRTQRANGNGTVYQRADGRWIARAYVLTPDGTMRRRDFYGATEAEANGKMVAAQAKSNEGIPADATGWTIERFLLYWLEHIVKPARKPKTYQGYELVCRVHLIPRLGKKRLNKLNGADVRLFLRQVEGMCLCCLHETDARRPVARCCAAGKCCQQRPSARLVQQIHSVLRNALQAAVREELIGRNVAKLVQVAGPEYETDRGLSLDQAKQVLAAAAEDRLYALFVLALYLGLRRGELLGLRWTDIDFDDESLEIERALQRVAGQLQEVTPKSRSSRRTVPLIGVCLDALRQHQKRQRVECWENGRQWDPAGYVFTSRAGTPIKPDNLRRSWYPIRKAAGVEHVVFHGMRHTCVTLLLNLGVPPHIVREIVGHSDIDVTMTIYAHASLTEKRAALKKLGEHLA